MTLRLPCNRKPGGGGVETTRQNLATIQVKPGQRSNHTIPIIVQNALKLSYNKNQTRSKVKPHNIPIIDQDTIKQ